MKLEIELGEADLIFKALKAVDPANLFCAELIKKIVTVAQATKEQEDGDQKED